MIEEINSVYEIHVQQNDSGVYTISGKSMRIGSACLLYPANGKDYEVNENRIRLDICFYSVTRVQMARYADI
jgi:hypothetical protein